MDEAGSRRKRRSSRRRRSGGGPGADGDGAVVDNSSMSSSRTRSGSSRSAVNRGRCVTSHGDARAERMGQPPATDAKSEAVAEPVPRRLSLRKPAKAAPMPADGIAQPSFTPASAASPAPSAAPSSPSASPSPQSSPLPRIFELPAVVVGYSSAGLLAAPSSSTPDPTATVAADSAGFASSSRDRRHHGAGRRAAASRPPRPAAAGAACSGRPPAGLASSVTSAFRRRRQHQGQVGRRAQDQGSPVEQVEQAAGDADARAGGAVVGHEVQLRGLGGGVHHLVRRRGGALHGAVRARRLRLAAEHGLVDHVQPRARRARTSRTGSPRRSSLATRPCSAR